MGTGSFPRVKRPGRGADHPPHVAPRLKEEWSYNSTPLWAFVACSRVKFTFIFYCDSIMFLLLWSCAWWHSVFRCFGEHTDLTVNHKEGNMGYGSRCQQSGARYWLDLHPWRWKKHVRKARTRLRGVQARRPHTVQHCASLSCRGRLKCDGTRAETSPFKSGGGGWSVQSTTVSRRVRIGGSDAGYTMFRGSVKSTGYPPHSPVSTSLPLPCVTVCHHISTGLYHRCQVIIYL